jgi:hypothetical protein
MSRKTIPISIRLDEDLLNWFKEKGAAEGVPYQGIIKSVLSDHVDLEKINMYKKIGRAQEVFRQCYTRCFWHYREDLEISESNLYLIVEGLKKYGGREGYFLAEELCQ